jgi:hypothetical protein
MNVARGLTVILASRVAFAAARGGLVDAVP